MSNGYDIYEYLKKNHIGKENAVFSKELEQRFSLSDRSLRRVISALRREGCPICSGCTGYYLGKTQKDVENTVAWLGEMAEGISESQDSMEKIDLEPKKEGVKIVMIVGAPLCFEDEEWDFPEKRDLACRLIRFFEENDTHEKERAREEAEKERVMGEAMRMLDSGLLMRALLDVMERVVKEETNYLKKDNYLRLLNDMQAFYERQARINAYEEAKRHAQRNHFCR